MICDFNASRRAGAPLCALAGARRRARPPPLRLRYASKDPPARLCRVSLICFVVAMPRTPPRPVSPPPVSSLRSAPLAVALALPPPEPGAWFATSLIVRYRA